jgi:RNA 3'-terminal phosphate cyclase
MFQSVLPTLLFCGGTSKVVLLGGTNVNKSPPASAIYNLLKPLVNKMGINF